MRVFYYCFSIILLPLNIRFLTYLDVCVWNKIIEITQQNKRHKTMEMVVNKDI